MNNSILVVHKNSSQLVSIIKNLKEGYLVTEEHNLEIALTKISQDFDFSCIMLEISDKPELEIEFLKKLPRTDSQIKIPVIAVYSQNDNELLEKLAENGVADFIDSTFSPKFIEYRLSILMKMKETSSVLQELEFDDLTGIYTRRAFLRKAENLVKQKSDKEYIILAIDFDNFKFTNRQYGERMCNEFLAFIGEQLRVLIEPGFAGRYGGDQFVAIFEYTEKFSLKYLSHYIDVGLVDAPIPHQKAKIGVYAPIDKSLPMTTCCDYAFLAIREIKGIYDKNIVFYEDSFQQKLYEEQKILSTMEAALLENQFLVYYQPKHESVSGKIAGCEALVRWEHPDFGFMNPGKFIPLFEKNGFITQLDTFIVNQVCEDIIRWKKIGIPIVPVSINISRRDYLEPGWMKKQIEIIDSYGIDHYYIHFEVTESLYAEYMDLIIEQVRQVQKQDFKIEMDDFGSGYSTLGLLATFPLNVIKLDISFVRHIDTNEIVIENVIKMAHRMGLSVIAEGAETAEQFKILKTLGCDLIQGFCFSKPLCRSDFEDYLKEHELLEAKTVSQTDQMLSDFDSDYSSEYLLRAAAEVGDTIPGGFFCYHADGNHEIISFNNEILKIYECNTAGEFREFVDNSFEGMVYPEDYKKITEDIDFQITDTNDIDHVRYRITTAKGKIKYIDDYGKFVRTKKYGNIFYVFINDITHIHEQHLEAQKRIEVIQGLSRSYKSIYLLDFDANRMLAYAESPKYKMIMDYTRSKNFTYDEVVTFFADNFIVEEEREKVKAVSYIKNIRKIFEKDDFYSYTFHLINNGIVTLTELAMRKLDDENQGTRAVLTFRTVSEDMINAEVERNQMLLNQLESHKKKEEQNAKELQNAYAEAESANRANMLLVTKYTDELKQPISQIKSAAESGLSCGSLDAAKSIFSEIWKNGEKLDRMTANIQKANHVITGISENFEEKTTDCSPAIQKILISVSEAAKAKNITLKTFSDIKNPYIYQDMDKTAQITINIVNNAIKYTMPGGTVTFGLKQLPGKTPDECVMEFTCSDTGIGISKEFLPHIMEPFAREKNEINDTLSSSGLGLSIVNSILKLNGGEINIISEKGKGSTVVVTQTHRFAKKTV